MAAPEQRRGPEWGREAPGECRLTEQDGQIMVARADPHVWMTDEFLRKLVGPESRNPWVTLTYQPHDLCRPEFCCQRFRDSYHCYSGAQVTISACNGVVTYRIGRFLRGGFWEAERQSRSKCQ
jgi:hypothetical protein